MSRGLIQSICLATTFAWASTSHGEPSRDAQHHLGTPASGQRHVIGVKNQNCSTCHVNSGPKSDKELPPDLRSASNDGWILGDELLTWSRQDHHYNAFAILRNEQSRQMARLLGIVDEKGESLVHRDRRCLTCHSSVPLEQMESHGNLVDADTIKDSRYTIGVSCEACHGPAGKDKTGTIGWGSAHFTSGDDSVGQKTRWRMLNAEDKFAKFGYWDVRSPETQSRVCLSCHLGSVEQKKIITHEMYAAGHPPLPSFELSQFVRQMPKHWRRLDEKPENVRDTYRKDRHALSQPDDKSGLDSGSEEFAMTKATMISSLVALEESMRLTADLIDEMPETENQPELASYACFACHHELVRDGWRKSRRLTATPGRPTLHEWPMTLARAVELTLQRDGEKSTLDSKYAAVATVLNSQPFGKKNELIKAARDLADASLSCCKKLRSTKIDDVLTRRFLKNLARQGAIGNVDYDSARQLVWAYERTLAQFNESTLNEGKRGLPLRCVDDEDRFGQDPILQNFEQPLLLWLRANRKAAATVSLAPQGEQFSRTQKEINISDVLNKIAKYDPAIVREIFERLLNQLDN